MLQIPLWKRVLILGVCLCGILFSFPNFFYEKVETHNKAAAEIEQLGVTPDREASLATWPSYLPSTLVNLGLDLRGGAQLLVKVQTDDVYQSRMDALWPDVRDQLVGIRDQVGFVERVDGSPAGVLQVRIQNADALNTAVAEVRELAQPVVSLTGLAAQTLDVTGQGNVISVELTEAEKIETDNRTLQQTQEILRRRIDPDGTTEPSITRQGNDRVLIQVPGVSGEELKGRIGTPARLTFHPVVRQTSNAEANPGPGNIVLPDVDEEGFFYVLEATPILTGDDLTDAQPSFDQNGRPAVGFRFNPSGARVFCNYTTENTGALFATVLDDEVITAPQIQEPICGGSGQITGNFTVEGSTELAVLLRAGALPADLDFLEERTVSPTLGQDSIEAGQIACIIAFIAVLIFMAMSYGLFGIFANIALLLNVSLLLGVLSVVGATLTLPGIAGIVLTIGMAVDANVLVFERIREELKTAKGPSRAIELGYEKALSAIIDANITTGITALILFALGSGPVKGFGVTLLVGIATSVFTAIFVTRLFVILWFERRRPKTIEV
ncbi:MAG: protein translocase subunit SecD [Paracoccaceae bacterium]|nr:protein translocase subunit SecD [Paracoccaceae bacterium]